MVFRDCVPASREAGCSPGGEVPQEEEIRLIRRGHSTLPTGLHLLHQEPSGEGCSRSLGDEEMYLLGIVLRPVLPGPKGERTCRSSGLHILQDKLKCCPKSPQFSQCFFSPQLNPVGFNFCGKLWTPPWRRGEKKRCWF